MNERNEGKLEGLCQHGNNRGSCVTCEKGKISGTLKNRASNFIRIKYKKFVEPTIQKINVARGKPTADSIARELENSKPFDMEAFLANTPVDERKSQIDAHGELVDPEKEDKK